MGMRIQAIRFSERGFEEIRREAEREGVTVSDFIREAAAAEILLRRNSREVRGPAGECQTGPTGPTNPGCNHPSASG